MTPLSSLPYRTANRVARSGESTLTETPLRLLAIQRCATVVPFYPLAVRRSRRQQTGTQAPGSTTPPTRSLLPSVSICVPPVIVLLVPSTTETATILHQFGGNTAENDGEPTPSLIRPSVVRRIADSHGWEVDVTESHGSDTRIEITVVAVLKRRPTPSVDGIRSTPPRGRLSEENTPGSCRASDQRVFEGEVEPLRGDRADRSSSVGLRLIRRRISTTSSL